MYSLKEIVAISCLFGASALTSTAHAVPSNMWEIIRMFSYPNGTYYQEMRRQENPTHSTASLNQPQTADNSNTRYKVREGRPVSSTTWDRMPIIYKKRLGSFLSNELEVHRAIEQAYKQRNLSIPADLMVVKDLQQVAGLKGGAIKVNLTFGSAANNHHNMTLPVIIDQASKKRIIRGSNFERLPTLRLSPSLLSR